tara:strand:+ start:80 stop:682 length:603 start_codon:yes stop_codon:yes gene_type:complete
MIYEFIEIGTSDFDTLIEKADDNTVGLCIEPIQMYLDNLPDKKNVKKICLGISNCIMNEKIFYIKPENIKKYGLPWWIRGCNSISKPHYQHMNRLDENTFHVLESQDVEIITTKEMIERYDIEGVKFLKVDTEGHDNVILLDYLENCIHNPSLFPDKILFETNILSSKEDQEKVIQGFVPHGYKVRRLSDDTILEKIKKI